MKRHEARRGLLRIFVVWLAALSAALSAPPPAAAQDWPARNITVVVPLGAGSASDIMARTVMEQVSRQVGQTIVIENRPGAGGGEIGARRLHDPGLRRARHRPRALRKAALRHAERLHPGHRLRTAAAG